MNGSQKDYVEALLRSLLLVFMDNATAEYTFISTFFTPQPLVLPEEPQAPEPPSAILSPDGGGTEVMSPSTSEFGSRMPMSSGTTPGLGGFMSFVAKSKEEQAVIDAMWKQVMDPVMDYCTVYNNHPPTRTPLSD